MINRPAAESAAIGCSVCLVVPCFNEGARLDIEAFRGFAIGNPWIRIVFVDDGSSDNTLEVLHQLQRGYEDRMTILPSKPNHGKAEAVRLGVLLALDQFHPSIVGFWDADLATPLDAIPRFMQVFDARAGIEMVFGSRVKLLGRDVRRRALRHYLGRIFATVVSTMLQLPIYDTQCGAKLFRVEPETRAIFADPFLSRWVFDVEIIARYLKFHNCDTERMAKIIYEYPLETWVDIAGSKVRPRDFLTALADIIRIRRKYLS